jgi:hypothetical protein
MDLMRRLLFLLSCSGALLYGADVGGPYRVYMVPMRRGLDQYLANRIVGGGVLQIVTDPKLADAVMTETLLGEKFLRTMESLSPAPKNTEAAKPTDTARGEGQPAGGNAERRVGPPGSATSRGQGTIFLVDAKSQQVVWSTYDPAKGTGKYDLDRAAADIVRRLQKDIAAEPLIKEGPQEEPKTATVAPPKQPAAAVSPAPTPEPAPAPAAAPPAATPPASAPAPAAASPAPKPAAPAGTPSSVPESSSKRIIGFLDFAGDATGSEAIAPGGTLRVQGWAVDTGEGAPARGVTILIDGKPAGMATLGDARSDVANGYHITSYTPCGWHFLMPTSSLSAGDHTVTATGSGPSGAALLAGSKTIKIPASGPQPQHD